MRQFKKFAALFLVLVLVLCFVACGNDNKVNKIKIAIPNDTTNEARALMLLEANGIIKLKEGVGITATINDIVEKPANVSFDEVQAENLPRVLADYDYAVINGNYALDAGLKPTDALSLEGSASAYGNVVCVKKGNEDNPLTKALVAAVSSQKVADYIKATYSNGAVVSVVDNPTNGFDSSVDYASLKGQKITVACSPAPHASILEVAKAILAEKDITLEIMEFEDYVQPNLVVGSNAKDALYANYFAHVPYQDAFNKEYLNKDSNYVEVVSVAQIHCEPMGLYGGKQTTLDALKTK